MILFLLSFVTWVPGLAIFAIESSLSGVAWATAHWRFAAGVMVGSMLWISSSRFWRWPYRRGSAGESWRALFCWA